MTGGAAVGAINLQAERRLAGALERPGVGGIENGRLLGLAELDGRHDHKARPRTAERDEDGNENGATVFHDFTSGVSSGAVTAANTVLTSASFHLIVMAKMFTSNSTLPSSRKINPVVLIISQSFAAAGS